MANTIEDILHDTLQAAQSTFKGKSHNISYYDPNILPERKKAFYTEEGMACRDLIFDRLHERLFEKQLSSREIYHYLHRNKNYFLVGNCILLSIFALYYLKKKHKNSLRALFYNPNVNYTRFRSLLNLQIICLQAPYSHAFVMVSPPSNADTKPYLGMISEPNVFPQNAWICDPWANIICPAMDYDKRWKARMSEWNMQGKIIHAAHFSLKNDPHMNGSPLGKYAYTATQRGVKMTTGIITIYPDGSTVIHDEPSSGRCTIL
ncbi:hypothetical protein Xbed_00739 [Xenorhabdus beddingii]|uniref:Uncharacterized protein n=1 Tax=Xenorhabdus beddingii TaxID=40578 RepID=A0A1Y2SQL2_9GAMM|nr:hypothetical protein [Xenorhabdus beddingii]OTA21093.1 hypothetical protein Xbed_00739 [Xenorhabdus beddingii]